MATAAGCCAGAGCLSSMFRSCTSPCRGSEKSEGGGSGCQFTLTNLCNFMRLCDRCNCCSKVQVGGNYDASDHSVIQVPPEAYPAVSAAAKRGISGASGSS